MPLYFKEKKTSQQHRRVLENIAILEGLKCYVKIMNGDP